MSENFDSSEIAKKIMEIFFLPNHDNEQLCQLVETIQLLDNPYYEIAQTFRHNVTSTITTAAFPYFLAHSSVVHRRFEKILMAERIRSLKTQTGGPEPGPTQIETRDDPYEKALAKFAKERNGSDYTDFLVRSVYEFLLEETDPEIARPANEKILNQSLVLIWSAFEILCRGMFEAKVNENPYLVDKIMNDAQAGKKFNINRVSYDLLRDNNFDISDKLGTTLVSQQDFSDFRTIKSALLAISCDRKALKTALDNETLWKLFQKRNLFVHRRGIVDSKYIANTGEEVNVGTKCKQNPEELEKMIATVTKAGDQVIFHLTQGSDRECG
jgi:hypothetical protein